MQSDNLTLLSGNSQPEPKSAQDTLALDQEQKKVGSHKGQCPGTTHPVGVTAVTAWGIDRTFTWYTKSLQPGYPKGENIKDFVS